MFRVSDKSIKQAGDFPIGMWTTPEVGYYGLTTEKAIEQVVPSPPPHNGFCFCVGFIEATFGHSLGPGAVSRDCSAEGTRGGWGTLRAHPP